MLKYFFKENKNELFFFASLLWLSSPIVFFGESHFEVDGHISYLIVFLFFHSLLLNDKVEVFIYQITLLTISFFLKETTFIILAICLLLNSIFYRKYFIKYLLLLFFSIIFIFFIFYFYSIYTDLSLSLFLKWKFHRFEFLLPGVISNQELSSYMMANQIKSILIAFKGLFKYGYLNLYLIIFFLIFNLRNIFLKNRINNFSLILFLVSLIVVFATGSYSPRYQVAYILPIIIILITNVKFENINIDYKSIFFSNIIIIIFFLLVFGNYIENTNDVFSNKFIKFPILFFPTLILLLFIAIDYFRGKLCILNTIIYSLAIALTLNMNLLRDDESDYLNNPGTVISMEQINHINDKYKNFDIIVNTIDISPYFDNINKTYYLKGYASILPGVDISLLKISNDEKINYELLNDDKCVGAYRCSYDSENITKFLASTKNVIYLENTVIKNNKNSNFTKEFDFKLVDNIGSFKIYKFNYK